MKSVNELVNQIAHIDTDCKISEDDIKMVSSAEYKILYSSYVQDLESQVNLHIKDGWYPSGDLFCAERNFYQAMMR